jgi:hypothetical protein
MEWIIALIVLLAFIPFILWLINHYDKIGIAKAAHQQQPAMLTPH